jgi:drug/metabolite transporter (DMT)-like permease
MFTIFTGLASSLSYAVSDMLSQRVVRAAHALRVVFWVLAIGVLLVVPAALLIEGVPSGGDEWRGALVAACAGVFYIAAYICLIEGLRHGDLSIVTALNALQGAIIAAWAVANGEHVTALIGAGLTLAVVGGTLSAVQGRARSAAGAGWALASAVLFAVVVILYDHAQALPALSIAAVSRLASFVVAVPLVLIVAQGVAIDRTHARAMAGAGVLEVLGLVLMNLAVASGPLAVAGVMISQFATFGLLLGLVLLHERPRPHQLVGVACTIVAVTLLSIVT